MGPEDLTVIGPAFALGGLAMIGSNTYHHQSPWRTSTGLSGHCKLLCRSI